MLMPCKGGVAYKVAAQLEAEREVIGLLCAR
jgi:hypothetical protein